MPETRNLCVQLPLDLHQRVCEARKQSGLTIRQYITNALMAQEVAVRMTNFALMLNDLNASFEGRNEYIARLCCAPLLILDDFGMEREGVRIGTSLQRDRQPLP